VHGGPNGGRRSPLSRAFLSDVFQDFLDGCGLGDEGKDLHLGPTAPTGQWVDFIDAVDELGPALGEGAPGWRGVGCIVGRSAIPCPVGGANAIGVGAVEMDEVLVGFRNVDEGSGQKLERVEQFLVQNVMSGLGFIKNEIGLWMKSKSGQVHGSPHEITRQLVHSLGVAGIDGGVVVNAKAGMTP